MNGISEALINEILFSGDRMDNILSNDKSMESFHVKYNNIWYYVVTLNGEIGTIFENN